MQIIMVLISELDDAFVILALVQVVTLQYDRWPVTLQASA